jgi:3-oxoadipate enol-lactonase
MPSLGGTRFVEGPHSDIAYRRRGSGPPVVLLHPLALSGEVWSEFAEQLSEVFDVIATDARGHGETGWDGDPFSIDDLGDDLGALLDGLGLASARVVGISMGGSTAVSFAGRHPGRVDAMVLADTTVWYGADACRIWEERAQVVLERSRLRQVPFQVDRWFTEGFRQRNPKEVNRIAGIFLRTDSLAHAQACRALGRMDCRALLKEIIAPTLVLTGVEDYATPPAMGEAIAEGVQNGTARTLDSLRHLSLIENPALAASAAVFLTTGQLPE